MSQTSATSSGQRVIDDTTPLLSIVDMDATCMVKDSSRTSVNDAVFFYVLAYPELSYYKNYVVREIRWYKDTKGIQHEFIVIVAEVKNTPEGVPMNKPVYFRMDRGFLFSDIEHFRDLSVVEIAGDPDLPKSHPAAYRTMRSRVHDEWKAGRPIFSCIWTPTEEYTIHRLPDRDPFYWPKSKSVLLYTLIFGSNHETSPSSPRPPNPQSEESSLSSSLPYLRDILIAMRSVVCSARGYNVVYWQCYYMAWAFVRLMERHYASSVTAVKGEHYDGRASRFVMHTFSLFGPREEGIGPLLPPGADTEGDWELYSLFCTDLNEFDQEAAQQTPEIRALRAERAQAVVNLKRMALKDELETAWKAHRGRRRL
ncbi:hypothetical protein CVT24_010265 [Panaeolus cyanescens]|uniref:Uncharacterized protein n=1 Tax=Panaeolus cyanescens TaxID=181874 RepID=A0A409YQ10_9AGAR|nr:hypothetical protein CVT24_010265 [Panaeolus cyanescens]